MSETPRTDKEASGGWSGDAICVPVEFARELERENTKLRARAMAAVDAIGHWMPAMDTCDRPTANTIRALRDVCGWKRKAPGMATVPIQRD